MRPDAWTAVVLAAPAAALVLVAAQPRARWRAGAEHSRRFWASWVLVAAAVGVAGWDRLGGGAGSAWLTLWCALGSAQPSMIADLVDVRRLQRRRPAASPPIGPDEAGLRPVRWPPPVRGEPVAWDRRARVG